MKQLQDIDFKAAYGPVPSGFSRSVQQALYRTKEEPMKKFSIRAAVLSIAAMLVLMAVAFATTDYISPTQLPTTTFPASSSDTPAAQGEANPSGDVTYTDENGNLLPTFACPTPSDQVSYTVLNAIELSNSISDDTGAYPDSLAMVQPYDHVYRLYSDEDSTLTQDGLCAEITQAYYDNGAIYGTLKITLPRNRLYWEPQQKYINDVCFVDFAEDTYFENHFNIAVTALGVSCEEMDWQNAIATACTLTDSTLSNEYEPVTLTYSFRLCDAATCPYSIRERSEYTLDFVIDIVSAYQDPTDAAAPRESIGMRWSPALYKSYASITMASPTPMSTLEPRTPAPAATSAQ